MARGQEHKKIQDQGQPYRGQTLSRPRTGASAPQKKRSSQKFFRRSPQKNVFQKIFQALHKLLTTRKTVLSSSRGRPIFEDLRLRGQGLQNVSSRPRTSRGLHLWTLVFGDHLKNYFEDLFFGQGLKKFLKTFLENTRACILGLGRAVLGLRLGFFCVLGLVSSTTPL